MAKVKSQPKLEPLERCPGCRSPERKKLFTLPESAVHECLQCGLRYLNPCLAPEATAAAYESQESLLQYHGFHAWYYDYGDLSKPSKTRDEYLKGLRLLEKHIGKPSSILDIGFGSGFFLALGKSRGWKVSGIDTSEDNVKKAKEKFGLELSCGRLEHDIPDGAGYGAVSFWDLIEHFPDPDPVLQKTARILKPRGWVLIGVPNDRNLLVLIGELLYKLSAGRFKLGIEKMYFLEHVSYYNLRTLEGLMARNGFVLRGSFLSSTDLARYALPLWEKWVAGGLLTMGRAMGLGNRLIALFQKQ